MLNDFCNDEKSSRTNYSIRVYDANFGDKVISIYLHIFVGDKEKVTRQSKAGHIIGGDAVSSTRKSSAVHQMIHLDSRTCLAKIKQNRC